MSYKFSFLSSLLQISLPSYKTFLQIIITMVHYKRFRITSLGFIYGHHFE
jgi:hypothetical protein